MLTMFLSLPGSAMQEVPEFEIQGAEIPEFRHLAGLPERRFAWSGLQIQPKLLILTMHNGEGTSFRAPDNW